MATTNIHRTADRRHLIRMPLLAAAAGLASIAGVAAAVVLTDDDDPSVGPAVVEPTPPVAAYSGEQLIAEMEAILAATTGLVDPTQTHASAVGVAPSEPTSDPVVAAAIADLQSNALGLPPAPQAALTEAYPTAVGPVPGGSVTGP